ncbi:hypothetical protein P692DRAFT_20822426 [Suillus brevipes Sb2]|nr:hypothetical protein P692DRAFT_20822426 [Suillus brevipes Sb2]
MTKDGILARKYGHMKGSVRRRLAGELRRGPLAEFGGLAKGSLDSGESTINGIRCIVGQVNCWSGVALIRYGLICGTLSSQICPSILIKIPVAHNAFNHCCLKAGLIRKLLGMFIEPELRKACNVLRVNMNSDGRVVMVAFPVPPVDLEGGTLLDISVTLSLIAFPPVDLEEP